MDFKHNNIIDQHTREKEEDYNKSFIQSLDLSIDINQFERYSKKKLPFLLKM